MERFIKYRCVIKTERYTRDFIMEAPNLTVASESACRIAKRMDGDFMSIICLEPI